MTIVNIAVVIGAILNMPTEFFLQPASDVRPQFEDQQGRSIPLEVRSKSHQEGRVETVGEVDELRIRACRGLYKIAFHFQVVSNRSGFDQCSYSKA